MNPGTMSASERSVSERSAPQITAVGLSPEAERVAALVGLAQGGDPRAFSELMAAYQNAFYGLARRYTQSHEDADDVLQEAFVKIFQNLSGLTRREAFFPWARRIMVNTALDTIRRRRRSSEVEVPATEGIEVTQEDSRLEPPDRRVERCEFFLKLERALRALPPRQREIVTLHDIEGLDTEEIARRCDCPPATVRSNLFYGREKLRRMLSGHR
ncbi:MAG TPA: RNA polymerase sigma factor [Gemmatimonadota bacterium]|nr:RNA polymerase sigma factor [Gemmatimonadota bacterium]